MANPPASKRSDVTGISGKFRPAIEFARDRLKKADPAFRAFQAGVDFDDHAFRFSYLGRVAEVSFPEGECLLDGQPASGVHSVLLLHYVLQGKDISPSGRWISYRELPDSSAYEAAFLSRGPHLVASHFGNNPEEFERCTQTMGGERMDELPGLAFRFAALPRIPLAVILHPGEEGLPAGGQMLFDATAPLIWVAEDLAVLGEVAATFLCRCTSSRSE